MSGIDEIEVVTDFLKSVGTQFQELAQKYDFNIGKKIENDERIGIEELIDLPFVIFHRMKMYKLVDRHCALGHTSMIQLVRDLFCDRRIPFIQAVGIIVRSIKLLAPKHLFLLPKIEGLIQDAANFDADYSYWGLGMVQFILIFEKVFFLNLLSVCLEEKYAK